MKNKTKEQLLEIIQRTSDEKEKRRAKLYLWHMMESWSDKQLQQSLVNGIEIEKENADFHLWRRYLDTSLDNLLDIVHNSQDNDKIHEALFTIGNKKYYQAIDILITLLNDSTPDNYVVRNAVAYSLHQLEDDKAFPALVAQLKKYPDYSESIVYALGVFDCSSIVIELVDLFIAYPEAPYERALIRVCFNSSAMGKISADKRTECLLKIDLAMQESKSEDNTDELEHFYFLLQDIGHTKSQG